MRSGDAINVVPAAGELVFDMRADRLEAFEPVLAAVPPEIGGVALEASDGAPLAGDGLERGDRASLLARAGERLGRPIVGVARGGASDASHFASDDPADVDGLGPRGGGAHTPEEFVLTPSLRERAEVALAVARARRSTRLR